MSINLLQSYINNITVSNKNLYYLSQTKNINEKMIMKEVDIFINHINHHHYYHNIIKSKNYNDEYDYIFQLNTMSKSDNNTFICYDSKFIIYYNEIPPKSRIIEEVKKIDIEWNGRKGKNIIHNLKRENGYYKFEISLKNMFYPLIINKKKYFDDHYNINVPSFLINNTHISHTFKTIQIPPKNYFNYYNGYEIICYDKNLKSLNNYEIQSIKDSVLYFVILHFYYINNRVFINKDVRKIIYEFSLELELYKLFT